MWTEIESRAAMLQSVPTMLSLYGSLAQLLPGASTDIVSVADGHCGGGCGREETDDR